MNVPRIPGSVRPILFLLALGGLAGCGKGGAGRPAPGPAEVGVVTLAPQRVALTTDLPGRTTAYRIAEVRPQVNGVILKRLFVEGSEVEAGQQLYQIDPAPYQAALDSAQAALARDEATAVSARLLAQRYQPLVAANAVSKQDYDNALASRQQAEADIAAAKANVETARINLAYTKVFSPIAGRTGRSSVTEGALVTAEQTASLVTVQQLDPIYVDVTQSSVQMLRLQREMAAGQIQATGPGEAEAVLTLEDNSAYGPKGKIEFSEVTVDPTTGMVTLRALFPNPQRQLLPGMFVHARIAEGVNEHALLVPQQGVTHDPRGQATALVVGGDGKVALRVLQAGRAIGDQWLVTDGLQAGDKVIVEGLQKTAPGATVKAVEAAPSAAPAPAAP